MAAFDVLANSWPLEYFAQALEALAEQADLGVGAVGFPEPNSANRLTETELPDRVMDAAETLELEAVRSDLRFDDSAASLVIEDPRLLCVQSGEGPRLLAVAPRRRAHLRIIGPDLAIHSVTADELSRVLRDQQAMEARAAMVASFEKLPLTEQKRSRLCAAIVDEELADRRLAAGWALRLPPHQSLFAQFDRAGLTRLLVGMLSAELLAALLAVIGWWLVGRASLFGVSDRQWLLAWGLLAATVVFVSALGDWWHGRFSLGLGTLLKRRLMRGIQQLNPDEMRTQGAGNALARVFESNAFEASALDAGLTTLTSLVHVSIAVGVLSLGAGGGLHVLMLVGWIGLVALLGQRYFRARARWTRQRLAISNDLIERMVGHRTLLAQLHPSSWHAEEDVILQDYIGKSADMDRAAVRFKGVVAKAWLPLGLLGLIPPMAGGGASAASIAVGVGGVLMAQGALERVAQSIEQLTQALISWEQVRPLYRAAARSRVRPSPESVVGVQATGHPCTPPLLEVRELVYQHPMRPSPTLDRCQFALGDGERVLLTGPSGAGKSTLASLLASLRGDASGLLLLHGLDIDTVGSMRWRRQVVLAPQFQENYVFNDSLAFNLLFGRRWPASESDFIEAYDLCCELGLGGLLQRMPSGMHQIVGSAGWQLSHGECSRLYVARALLQKPDVIILDESLGALDPESQQLTLDCVLKHAGAVIMIAHP